ncbi:unnamed protein product [Rhizoctonia solani]|uniref:Uncharacterized protein n=1 Tax=Rhizoctonia solani TaxID=456999 RepID=A0A8H3BCN1_9AGAM|nr:unnamed protein product [Rhizoctonia solani]
MVVFYLSTIILGAVVPHCPFVTQASISLKKILELCRRAETQGTENSVPDTAHKDIQALLWLANHSKDPDVASCPYQAMAGLRQLLNPVSSTSHTTVTDPKFLQQNLDKKTTRDKLLSTAVQQFQTLLDGALEFASPEVVVRYAIAVIAIRASIPDNSSSQISWLELLELINRIGHSRISSGSISPNVFANLLIAEMEAIKFAFGIEKNKIQFPIRRDSLDNMGITKLLKCTNEWLQLVSMVLAHHFSGQILLNDNILTELLYSIKHAAPPNNIYERKEG